MFLPVTTRGRALGVFDAVHHHADVANRDELVLSVLDDFRHHPVARRRQESHAAALVPGPLVVRPLREGSRPPAVGLFAEHRLPDDIRRRLDGRGELDSLRARHAVSPSREPPRVSRRRTGPSLSCQPRRGATMPRVGSTRRLAAARIPDTMPRVDATVPVPAESPQPYAGRTRCKERTLDRRRKVSSGQTRVGAGGIEPPTSTV